VGRIPLPVEELEVGTHAPVAVAGGHDEPDQVVPGGQSLHLLDEGLAEGVIDLVHARGALQPEGADAGLLAALEAEVGVVAHVTPAR
jgi:hypothetical protein